MRRRPQWHSYSVADLSIGESFFIDDEYNDYGYVRIKNYLQKEAKELGFRIRIDSYREVVRIAPLVRKRDLPALERRATRYGVTAARVQARYEAAGRCCELCRKPLPIELIHIDHCHVTGAPRGLLCAGCNTGLGKLGDSIEGLQRAIRYLERFEKWEKPTPLAKRQPTNGR